MTSRQYAQRVPVLMYHRIGQTHNPWERKYCVTPERFAEHMAALEGAGMQAVSIDRFFAWLDHGEELPAGSFLLTFDDGFLGVHENAAPVLEELAWPATVFLVSALIGQEDSWSKHENPGGRTYPLMGREHIDSLAKRGFSFHSHSRHHADLTALSMEALQEEVAGAKLELEDVLGVDVRYFAYPYGKFDESVFQAVKDAGYRAAFSVQPGFNREDVDRFRIRRLDVFGTDTAAMLLRKVRLGSNEGSLRHSLHYYAGRLFKRLGVGG